MISVSLIFWEREGSKLGFQKSPPEQKQKKKYGVLIQKYKKLKTLQIK